MKNKLIIAWFIFLTFLFSSCSQKEKNETKEVGEINLRLNTISNKIENIQSVLERIVFNENSINSLKTNKKTIGNIIESGAIDYQLKHANLENIEKSLLETQDKLNQQSSVKIDPFEENIYPINVRYGSLVLWMKSAQNSSDGFEVKISIINTLSVDIGDLIVSLHANYNSNSKTRNDRQYLSNEKISKIQSGKIKDVSIKFIGENIKEVDSFTANIIVRSVQPN